MTYRKKMIEVSIPLDAINAESSREKSIRHGHPSTMHLWWARRPLAACRAVIFCSLIDDPGEEGIPQRELELIDALPAPDPRPLDWDKMDTVQQRRERLFSFIAQLVKWENSNNDLIIGTARELIMAATDNNPPPVLDPFCGGGSIPLEAQRLGLKAYASDLNPVAVLITKALVEIPPKFANRPPVNPDSRQGTGGSATWKGAAGLADDVRYYGKWMRDQAWDRIGHLYPKGPNGETVIAWLWARTVKCPNPACGANMPLARSFQLATKPGRQSWVEPIPDPAEHSVQFRVRHGQGTAPNGTVNRNGAQCCVCGTAVPFEHIRREGLAGQLGQQLMAMVGLGDRRRIYLDPDPAHRDVAIHAEPQWVPESKLPDQALGFRVQLYGLTRHADLFTSRQLATLSTFAALVAAARQQVLEDSDLDDAYADAIATYLALNVSKTAGYLSTLCAWMPGVKYEVVSHTFVRQALSMSWDFAEANPFAGSSGDWSKNLERMITCFYFLPNGGEPGQVFQLDSTSALPPVDNFLSCTDPPYYDNVGYADLSDFFYVWLRRAIGSSGDSLFATLLTPKSSELIAAPYRFGGDRQAAERHFEVGLARTFSSMGRQGGLETPFTLFYAFKQEERREGQRNQTASTGWETMLEGLMQAGFQVVGTWPVRTERTARIRNLNSNALASSIVIGARRRPSNAPLATLREFNATLLEELSPALNAMITGHIAPVDLAQSVIGPGMAVFSRYAKVVEPDGSEMTVRRALELINNAVENYMAEREGSMDRDTQFCINWFEEHGFSDGPYGQADVLARAKNIGVEALARGGVLTSGQGKVQLLDLDSYVRRVEDYDPTQDSRISAWEACHYLAAAITPPDGSEEMAGRLARRLGGLANDARDLSYRLYAICEHKGWSQEGQVYNLLANSWPAIQAAAASYAEETQAGLGL